MSFAIYTPKDVEDVAALQYTGNNIEAVKAFIFPKKLVKGPDGWVFNKIRLYPYDYVLKDKYSEFRIFTEKEFNTNYNRQQ